MRSINMLSLEVRVGRCNLNLKSEGSFAVSLQMGSNTSSYSPIKKIQNNCIHFNTTLRMSIQKQLLQQNSNCRILLHLVRENRQRTIIGVATINIVTQNNKGFQYYNFGQCADCEADIQVSVNYGNVYELGVRSQINFFHNNQLSYPYNSQQYNHDLEKSRERQSLAQDSILDRDQYNGLKQSKAQSNIEYFINKKAKKSIMSRSGIRNDLRNRRQVKKRPQNLSQCPPKQIISHFQAQISFLQEELKNKQQWGIGMKQLVQQLEAENQLLKQIKVQQLVQNGVQNLEQGIQLVSKLVHSKFQASKSRIYESQISDKQLQKDRINEKNYSEQSNEDKALSPTKSIPSLPRYSTNQNQTQRSKNQAQTTMPINIIQSRQQLENALNIITGSQRKKLDEQGGISDTIRIAQLQEQIFKIRQEKNQLEEISQQMYNQLSRVRAQRDQYLQQLRDVEVDHQELRKYIESLKEQNIKIKQQNSLYQKSTQKNHYEQMREQNSRLGAKVKQLQRQLKQSVKAIQEFKNDALSARQQIIIKQEQINQYKRKYGNLDLYANGTSNSSTSDKLPQVSPSKDNINLHPNISTKHSHILNQQRNVHTLYTNLLQTSISQRKQLQITLQKYISQFKKPTLSPSLSPSNQQKVRKLQTKINKMFIQIIKNRNNLPNLAEIQSAKREITKQIQNMLAQ